MVIDLLYAFAALKAWAPKVFIQNTRAMAKDAYNNDFICDGNDTNPYILLNQVLSNAVSTHETKRKRGPFIRKKYSSVQSWMVS